MIYVLQPPVALASSAIVTLDGRPYRIKLVYDEALEGWHLSAYASPSGEPITEGWLVEDGLAVAEGSQSPHLWPGVLGGLSIAAGASIRDPNDVLAGRAALVYFDASEAVTSGLGGLEYTVKDGWEVY